MPDACDHPEHSAKATLIRTYDEPDRPDGWHLELSVQCTTCLAPVQFLGLPVGDGQAPSVSQTLVEVRLPCRPFVAGGSDA